MGRLFGTDGARGVANQELTCERAMEIGRATAMVLGAGHDRRKTFVIGKDTRLSSDMLETALAAGLCSVGADVLLLGVVPTPAVAYLISKYQADAGFMISASHNPFEYNGIKIFNHEGYKLPDATEEEIEAIILDHAKPVSLAEGEDLGRVTRVDSAPDDYADYICSTVDCRLNGLKVALDCSNGSASVTAHRIFSSLGAEVIALHDLPNGVNINKDCGSTCVGLMTDFVKENGCDLGLAFDGDADRCLAVDETGCVVDGDRIIAVIADHFKELGRLADEVAVVTVMSNIGFFRFAKEHGIKVEVTKVGDRYVLEKMREKNYSIGGEQSGHIIFKDFATTGDGELTGRQLMAVMQRAGKKLSELSQIMKVYPQVLVNVRVSADGKERLAGDSEVQEAIRAVESTLGEDGRILVRCSGTEPLIRVMVEGSNEEQIGVLANRVADTIRLRLA